MDPLLRQPPTHGLPFEDSPPPNLFISIFQQLWDNSNGRGYLSKSVSEETPPNLDEIEIVRNTIGEGRVGEVVKEEDVKEKGVKEKEVELIGNATALTVALTMLGSKIMMGCCRQPIPLMK